MSNKASVSNKIKNKTVNKSDLEVLNALTNNFVSNSVVTLATSCSASSSSYTEMSMGSLIVVGKKNKIDVEMETTQDSQLSLQCIQQALQQSNIGNDIAQSIMNNLTQSIDNEAMNKMVSESEAKNQQGMFSNPFASSSSSINLDVNNEQRNETSRKLANLISNSVTNNVKIQDIKDCFLKSATAINQQVGNVRVLGDNNKFELNMSSKQISSSFATCQQLTEQTSSIINSLVADLGLTIVDDTKNVMKTDTSAKATASSKTTGVEGVISAFGEGLMSMLGPIVSGLIMMAVAIGLLVFLMKKKGGGIKRKKDGSFDVSFGKAGSFNTKELKSKDKDKGKEKSKSKDKAKSKSK